MQPVKRVEIVVDALEVEKVLRLLAETGVGGYTLIRDAAGGGDRGPRHGDELTGVMQNSYIVVACPPHLLTRVVETVRPVLKRFGGMCLVSDALWVNH